MKKSFEKKIAEYVLSNCYTPPQGFEFQVKNLFLQLRQDNSGRYVPGQVSYDVFFEGELKSSGYVNILNLTSCPDCGGEADEYIGNCCCACDSERRFNLSDIEWVQELCIQFMDRDPSVNIPVSEINSVAWKDGGWDIHCDNGHNYRLAGDSLYDIGRDAGPNARPMPRAGMTL